MSKRNVEPKFLPCMATHFLHVTVNMSKKLEAMKDKMIEANGYCAPECLEASDKVQLALVEFALALEKRASKKLISGEDDELPMNAEPVNAVTIQ